MHRHELSETPIQDAAETPRAKFKFVPYNDCPWLLAHDNPWVQKGAQSLARRQKQTLSTLEFMNFLQLLLLHIMEKTEPAVAARTLTERFPQTFADFRALLVGEVQAQLLTFDCPGTTDVEVKIGVCFYSVMTCQKPSADMLPIASLFRDVDLYLYEEKDISQSNTLNGIRNVLREVPHEGATMLKVYDNIRQNQKKTSLPPKPKTALPKKPSSSKLAPPKAVRK